MVYFYPNKKKLLQTIRELTKQKISTSASEIFEIISQEERRSGYGTGNLQNVLYELFQEKYIFLGNIRSVFDLPVNYDQLQNIAIVLTEKGKRKTDVWYKRIGYFILYDKHNLFIILSFVLSVTAFIVSASRDNDLNYKKFQHAKEFMRHR